MQTIYLDIANKGTIPTIYGKQGDVGRKFLVVLTDAGVPYSPPAGSVFSVWYEGDSGEGNYTDIGDNSAFSVSGNKVTVELITQMLATSGEGLLCLVLNGADGSQIASWNIDYVVEFVPGANSEQAKDYFTAFSNAVQNLPYPDASLTIAGKAADALATGTALAGKAPGGYGLGGAGKELTSSDDLNTIWENGYYYWDKNGGSAPANSPVLAGRWTTWVFCGMTVRFAIETDSMIKAIQEVHYYDNGDPSYHATVRRFVQCDLDGSFSYGSEWEWENPPMELDEEYRTTERWNGKPVYRKLVKYTNTTAMSGDALTKIPHGVSNMDRTAGVEITTRTQGYQIPYVTIAESTSVTGCSATDIELRTTGTTSWSAGRDWYFEMRYNKTTD